MSIGLTLKLAWKNILGNRLRSGLTILGLVIGIASVIILVGIGNGAATSVKSQVASLGSDIITVSISDSEYGLSYDDLEEIESISGVKDITPYQVLSATISREGTTSQASIYGTGEGYTDMMGYSLASGRKLSEIDINNSTKAVIIGSGLAEDLWNGADATGDTIKIDGDKYTVVGVLEETGSSMGNNIDDMLIMPLTTARYLGTDTTITNFYVQAESDDIVENTVTALENYFTYNLGVSEDDISVSSQEMLQEAMSDINNTLSLLLGGIAGISLLVGGIGVMNVMLVSVTERTREIGIRKSLGARKKDILYQFLTEALVLSISGGIIGIIVGFIGGEIAVLLGATFAPGIGMVLLSFFVSICVGLIFGIFPAYRGACLHPVEALRYE